MKQIKLQLPNIETLGKTAREQVIDLYAVTRASSPTASPREIAIAVAQRVGLAPSTVHKYWYQRGGRKAKKDIAALKAVEVRKTNEAQASNGTVSADGREKIAIAAMSIDIKAAIDVFGVDEIQKIICSKMISK